MTDSATKRFKLFPRNLTARADAIVRGNPVTSRPESGVENDFPGLEFDQRNLDKVFFPGLTFELHHDAAIILRSFVEGHSASRFVDSAEVQSGVFLTFLQGVFASRARGSTPTTRTLRLLQPAGLESWRMVRDLEPGPVAIAICGADAFNVIGSGNFDIDSTAEWFADRSDRAIDVPGVGKVVLLFGERSRFVTAEGVIDPTLIEPGDLTRSLCSPWQYDFADCGCFYWASNKPDIVSSAEQPHQVLSFQRKDRSPAGDRATKPEDWILKYGGSWDGPQNAMRHAEMIQRWSELPFVVGGRETDRYRSQRSSKLVHPLSRESIISRLQSLAGVEHALLVEYLYAYHSLATPPDRPTDDSVPSRIWTAGTHVLQVAIDEMRHLRSVNEMLIELGQQPVLARATIIGEDYDGTGRAFQRKFELQPLTQAQLDWFIAVEQASQSTEDQSTVDGMYTLLLRSVEQSEEFSREEKQRVLQLIKTVIDEGIDHYERFSEAKRVLAGIPQATYLRVKSAPRRLPDGSPDRLLQDTVDAAYLVVLNSLEYVFRLGDQQRGALLEGARRAMYNMDDAARSLALRGAGALYTLPAVVTLSMVAAVRAPGERTLLTQSADRTSAARRLGDPLRLAVPGLEQSPRAEDRALASRLTSRLAELTRIFEASVSQVRGQ